MIAIPETCAMQCSLQGSTPSVPKVDHNEAGPWYRLRQSEEQVQTQIHSLVVNVPLELLVPGHGTKGDTLVQRLISGDDDDLRIPIDGLSQCNPPSDGIASETLRQAHATAALIDLLSDRSGIVARSETRVGTPQQHVKRSWKSHNGCVTHWLPSYYWSIGALWSSEGRDKELAGVRLTKHVVANCYSDSLSFDLQRQHAAELYNTAQLAGTAVGKRAREVLKGAHRVPSKAHLQVTSLARLLSVYKQYGCASSEGAPLVPLSDWEQHLARCREGSEPLSCPLAARPSLVFKHALAPEVLLNPALNEHALEAGLAEGAALRPSKSWRWALICESPATVPIPEQLADLIDYTLEAIAARPDAKKQRRDR